MHKHPHFALWLHDDAELAHIIGSAIVDRSEIHAWPLSCVERVTTANQRHYFYKAQSQPSVEVAVYAQVHAPCLAPVTIMPSSVPDCLPALLFGDTGARPIHPHTLTLDHIEQILAALRTLPNDMPHHRNLATWALWLAHMRETLQLLTQLIDTGQFTQVTVDDVNLLRTIAQSRAMQRLFDDDIGIVHGDCHPNNILQSADGLVVIDWQRPLLGPRIIDRIELLLAGGREVTHLPLAALQCWYLLRIDWLVQAGVHWVPYGCDVFDQQVKSFLRQMPHTA